MREMYWGVPWTPGLDRAFTRYLKLPVAKEIEIGLGVAIWVGLVFVVVHFGGLMAV